MRVRARRNHPVGAAELVLADGTVYLVVGFDDENYRVVNDAGEPCLYPKEWFSIAEKSIPNDWRKTTYPDGEYHVGPEELNEPGFYEDYFDGRPAARERFERVLRRLNNS